MYYLGVKYVIGFRVNRLVPQNKCISLQNSLLCIVVELAEGGSVFVDFGVVTGDMLQMKWKLVYPN